MRGAHGEGEVLEVCWCQNAADAMLVKGGVAEELEEQGDHGLGFAVEDGPEVGIIRGGRDHCLAEGFDRSEALGFGGGRDGQQCPFDRAEVLDNID